MSKRLWKIEPLGKPSTAHAADAIEIVGGEAVRRVTLSALDYKLYQQVAHKDPHFRNIDTLATALDLPGEEVSAGLRRLIATGLLEAADKGSLQ